MRLHYLLRRVRPLTLAAALCMGLLSACTADTTTTSDVTNTSVEPAAGEVAVRHDQILTELAVGATYVLSTDAPTDDKRLMPGSKLPKGTRFTLVSKQKVEYTYPQQHQRPGRRGGAMECAGSEGCIAGCNVVYLHGHFGCLSCKSDSATCTSRSVEQ